MAESNHAPFPHLRAAYLRAIAECWQNPAFLAELTARSEDSPRGVLPFLEQRYNFRFPFDVSFKISDKRRPIYRPVGTTGWFGFGDEFQVYLPGPPQDLKREGAAVLARYCAEFPSLLGAGIGSGVEAPTDFANFGIVTCRVLAMTWHDPTFSAALFQAADARQLIQDSMNWIVPWNFFIKFQQVEGSSSDSNQYWQNFPRSIITVHMPQPPNAESIRCGEVEGSVEPVALAAYNGTGAQYPFTCP